MSLGDQCRERPITQALGPICQVGMAALEQPGDQGSCYPSSEWAYVSSWHLQGILRLASRDTHPLHPHSHVCVVQEAMGGRDQVPALVPLPPPCLTASDFSLHRRGKVNMATTGIRGVQSSSSFITGCIPHNTSPLTHYPFFSPHIVSLPEIALFVYASALLPTRM